MALESSTVHHSRLELYPEGYEWHWCLVHGMYIHQYTQFSINCTKIKTDLVCTYYYFANTQFGIGHVDIWRVTFFLRSQRHHLLKRGQEAFLSLPNRASHSSSYTMSESDKYVVTVYASSSSAIDATFKAEARKLGEGLAKADYALCVGGGKYGLMGAVTDGCLASGGVADCVILKMFVGANMHPGPFRTTEVYDTMTARKDGLYRRADAFIALPGGLGTLEELSEVMSWRQLEIHSKPIVLINTNG